MATTTTTTCPSPSIATLTAIEDDDVVLTIGSQEEVTISTSKAKMQQQIMSPFLQSEDMEEDLEAVTVVIITTTTIQNLQQRLERFLLQRRKRGHRVRIFSKQEIRDWGSSPSSSSSNDYHAYENDCRFQMRVQR